MEEQAGNQDYKSPQRKLVRFFEKSRDQWKSKSQESKKVIKQQENRMRFLEKSKKNWREKALELQAENRSLKAELEEMKEKKEAQGEEKKTQIHL